MKKRASLYVSYRKDEALRHLPSEFTEPISDLYNELKDIAHLIEAHIADATGDEIPRVSMDSGNHERLTE